jgi:hypothetical protein
VKYRLVHLTFGPEEKLSLDIGIFMPTTGGPFSAVIAPGGTPPGATSLPRLPNGPTQGKGLDVLLIVGNPNPATTRSATTIPGFRVARTIGGEDRGGERGPVAWLCLRHLQPQ